MQPGGCELGKSAAQQQAYFFQPIGCVHAISV